MDEHGSCRRRPAGGVTDGGLETDLIFHRGLDLPDFASFPLLDDAGRPGGGWRTTTARTPSWRPAPRPACSWRHRPPGGPTATGAPASATTPRRSPASTGDAVEHLAQRSRRRWSGEGRRRARRSERWGRAVTATWPATSTPTASAPTTTARSSRTFQDAGADLATAYTLTTVAEATGIVRAGHQRGPARRDLLTVETDGRLPDGTDLGTAVGSSSTPRPTPVRPTCSSTAPTPSHVRGRPRRRRRRGRAGSPASG